MSTRVEGATVLVLVTAQATLSAGPASVRLSVREDPAGGTWYYNLSDCNERRIQYGRVAGMADYLDVLRHAARICRDAYGPGTTERGLLEQFASGQDQP